MRVSVAAQQYAVLVMDVPDLVGDRAAVRARAARAGAAGPASRVAAALLACLSHTILGKPRSAVSAEVLAAARDRAAARSEGGGLLGGGKAASAPPRPRTRSPSPKRSATAGAAGGGAFASTSATTPARGIGRPRLGASVEELLDDDIPIEPLAVVEETL